MAPEIHLREHTGVREVVGLLGERHVQGEVVTGLQQLARGHLLDPAGYPQLYLADRAVSR